MAGRLTQLVVESIDSGNPAARLSSLVVESLDSGTPLARESQLVIEALFSSVSIYNETVTSTLSLTQTITPSDLGQTLSQSLSLSQTIIGLTGVYSETQILTLTQTISVQYVHQRTVTSTLSLVSTIARNFTQTLTLSQTIVGVGSKHVRSVLPLFGLPTTTNVYNRSVTSTLTLRQPQLYYQTLLFTQAIRLGHGRLVTSTMSLSQTISLGVVRPITVTSAISISQVIICKTVLNISLPHTLTFSQNIVGTIVEDLVIFKSNTDYIILPSPVFSDTENLEHEMKLKRSMNNVKRTYLKTNNRATLTYTFRLDRSLSLAFRQFYINNSDKQITMQNFKGEIWQGYFKETPTFTKKTIYANCGEETDTSITFEGTKISG